MAKTTSNSTPLELYNRSARFHLHKMLPFTSNCPQEPPLLECTTTQAPTIHIIIHQPCPSQSTTSPAATEQS
ncbi:hypothetical protein M758_2G241800 [Ceratodon purpureus]|uniref:Uncharacterized protein n=1 Tax=Ceratodon purpureus TaxID=3225 RepID=A0A8T0J1G9_CERPU|nr:hypothetical protein KC19_2G288600 [Ceratodon purpureus]KAG0627984.1 hypothetical protein M758_2G241800 [Ceratodon purpureus]